MEGEETFEPSFLGSADEVVEERISDDAVVMIKGTKTTSAVSNLIYFKFFSFLNKNKFMTEKHEEFKDSRILDGQNREIA